MKIEYTKVGDYYLPNLVAPKNITNFKLSKYGKLRLNYLRQNKKAEYTILLIDNEEYIKLQKEYHKILDENENLIWVLEGDIKDRTLSNDECFALSKLVKIHYDIQSIEEKEIFFLGGKEAYFFFKKLGILA